MLEAISAFYIHGLVVFFWTMDLLIILGSSPSAQHNLCLMDFSVNMSPFRWNISPMDILEMNWAFRTANARNRKLSASSRPTAGQMKDSGDKYG